MQKVIGVRFKKAGKIHLFDPGDDDIQRGDSVIVETARGLECGEVVVGVQEIPVSESPTCPNLQTPRRIYRKASSTDLVRLEENRAKEKKAYEICLSKIAEHGLPMNLINVNYTFDLNKVIFYFTAEGRVDFRALVRDLAYIFHTRIELRQVGVREEAKLLGGVGCCGRALCCATFLGDFAPVSIRMAKEQNLSLNPTKISGICGRLLCCLKYESDYYHQNYIERAQNFQPNSGDRVIVEESSGKVISVNVAKKLATVMLDNNKTVVRSWEDLMPLENDEAAGEISKLIDKESIDVEEPAHVEPPPRRNERPERGERRAERRERPEQPERGKGKPNRPRKNSKKAAKK